MQSAWTLPFIDALRTTGNISAAARIAGVTSGSVYTRRATDADFANDWDNALEDATDVLEAEARRRALEGVDELIVYQGQPSPVWERDEHGELVMVAYDTGCPDKDGKPIMGKRPVQAVDSRGKPVWLTVNKKSDPLLMFMLKGLRKKYGTETTEISGPGGAPVAVDSSERAARVASLMALAAARKTGIEDLL